MSHLLLRFSRNYAQHFRETISLSLPVIIGQLGFILMGFIDNLMIGGVSYIHLSAASLANSMYFILAVMGMGVTMAITPLVAEANGAGETEKCGEYLRQGVWVGILTAIVLGILIFLSTLTFPYLNQPPEDVTLASPYLKIIGFSIFPMMLFGVYKQFADGLSLTLPRCTLP